jgi:hypothetical protein
MPSSLTQSYPSSPPNVAADCPQSSSQVLHRKKVVEDEQTSLKSSIMKKLTDFLRDVGEQVLD